MDSHNHLVNELEDRLLSIVEAKAIDLTCEGRVALEKMSSPLSEENKELNYFIHTHTEGVIVAQVKLIEIEDSVDTKGLVKVDAELSIKKFIKPQLSLSSAHVAVLIHSLKSLIQRVKLQSTHGETLSWKLDRVQRRVKLEYPQDLSLESSIWLIRQLARIINKVSQLSIEVIQEEAEYYRAIERWPYARRAYLSWHCLDTLSFEQLQNFLVILQHLKDWRACLNLLEESIDRYDQKLGAKLAFAASMLCKDVILDQSHALVLMQKANELDPENEEYQKHLSQLIAKDEQLVDEADKVSVEIEDHSTSEDDLDFDLPESAELKQELVESDQDQFFDEQSLSSDQLIPITDLPADLPETEAKIADPIQSKDVSHSSATKTHKPGHKAKNKKKNKAKNKKKAKKRSSKKR